jgi:3-oxoacyl-[acyl-carrier-protein] synthase II
VSGSKYFLDGSSLDFLSRLPESVPHGLASRWGIGGPVVNYASACATGVHSLLAAAGWVREGRVKAALAGAAESSLHPLYVAAFRRMGVWSPSGRVRPFDRDRDGFVAGEGAAVFVVEDEARALARGARALARVLGGDFGCDAHHAVRFNGGGRRMADSLCRALARAGRPASAVDYLNAHGTATVLNDSLETTALGLVFGGSRRPLVSSTKGATGHLLGAGGAVEIAFCLLALRDQTAPPTVNLDNPHNDEFDFVPRRARPHRVELAASVSFGFGGTLGSVVLGPPSC